MKIADIKNKIQNGGFDNDFIMLYGDAQKSRESYYEDVEEFAEVFVGIDEESGKPILEMKSMGIFKHPVLNPNYDPSKEYVNRADRPEWDTVGMLGKLYVRDDGTCQVNGYATVGENGIATASSDKTNMRVLSRVNENVVRVLLK